MKRFFIGLLAAAIVATAISSVAVAQATPEFKLGFKALADQIPDVVGQPTENEHYGANGDSLQQTTTGLMVWRKADNWTAFTNGSHTWINGPEGLQDRDNNSRFDWEAAAPPPDTSTPTPTPQPTATPVPTFAPPPLPTLAPPPTAAPKPVITVISKNVIQGQVLSADTLWTMGEIRNDSTFPAYNIVITANALQSTGAVAGSGNQTIPYLGPGESVGYRVDIKNAIGWNTVGWSQVNVTTDATSSFYAKYARLYVKFVKNEQDVIKNTRTTAPDPGAAFTFSGTVINDTNANGAIGRALTLGVVYVWFLDDNNNVVWEDYSFVKPSTLNPGDSYDFQIRTARERDDPKIPSITQVRYYAVGQLPQ